MRNILSVLVVSVAMVGCAPSKSVNVNLEYASTSLGYRNSGLLSAGSLFFWDLTENTLTLLSEDIELKEGGRTSPTSFEAKNLSGIEVSASGGVPEIAKAEIKTAIKNNYVYVVSNAVRVKSKHIYTSISREYVRLRKDGINVMAAWRIKDLDSNPQRYKLILARSPVYADSETLSFNDGGDGSIAFKLEGADDIIFKVKAPKEVSGKCSGDQALCYINLTVLDAKLVGSQDENGNGVQKLDYTPSSGFDKSKLPEALRSLN